MAWMIDGTLELMVHAERAEIIMGALRKHGVFISEDYDAVRAKSKGSPMYLDGMKQRMTRRLATLDPQQRGVRFHLMAKLDEIEMLLAAKTTAPCSPQRQQQQQPNAMRVDGDNGQISADEEIRRQL